MFLCLPYIGQNCVVRNVRHWGLFMQLQYSNSFNLKTIKHLLKYFSQLYKNNLPLFKKLYFELPTEQNYN